MPRININEIDNTVYSTNELTNDNIVYVPGNAITGEYRNPVLVTTTDDFDRQFGSYAPEGSPTYDYVRGLLIAGLPVLFRRIVALNQDAEDAESVEIKIKQAETVLYTEEEATPPTFEVTEAKIEGEDDLTVTIKATSSLSSWNGNISLVISKESEPVLTIEQPIDITGDVNIQLDLDYKEGDPEYDQLKEMKDSISNSDVKITATTTTVQVPQIKAKELWGGTYGNNLKVAIEKIGQSFYLRVYNGMKMIESELIVNAQSGDTEETLKQKELAFLKAHEFNSITLEILNEEEFNLPVGVFQLSGGEDISNEDVLQEIPSSYNFIADKYIYDVKFVTAGGYTDSEVGNTPIAEAQVALCEKRLDCFAVVDIPYGTKKGDVTNYFVNLDTSYAAAFAPWCYTKLPSGEEKWMAPSYLFLYTLGRSIQNGNFVYDAPAGVLKASMPQVIKPEYEIGGDTLDYWTSSNPQSINPLMKLQSYGYVIFGQNTLYNIQNKNTNKASALQKINVRLAINEIRRILFKSAIRLTFQANNTRTWNSFKALVEPKLDAMISNNGISDYLIQMDSTTTTEEDLQNNTIRARVSVSVMKAVENFEIDFYIEPQSIKFSEEEADKNVLVGGYTIANQ